MIADECRRRPTLFFIVTMGNLRNSIGQEALMVSLDHHEKHHQVRIDYDVRGMKLTWKSRGSFRPERVGQACWASMIKFDYGRYQLSKWGMLAEKKM